MYHDQTYTNEQHLVDFCEEQNLISAFHCQSHKRNHMWIWVHRNMRTKVQNRANSLRKYRAYSSVEIDLDDHIVTANFKISLRTPRKQ